MTTVNKKTVSKRVNIDGKDAIFIGNGASTTLGKLLSPYTNYSIHIDGVGFFPTIAHYWVWLLLPDDDAFGVVGGKLFYSTPPRGGNPNLYIPRSIWYKNVMSKKKVVDDVDLNKLALEEIAVIYEDILENDKALAELLKNNRLPLKAIISITDANGVTYNNHDTMISPIVNLLSKRYGPKLGPMAKEEKVKAVKPAESKTPKKKERMSDAEWAAAGLVRMQLAGEVLEGIILTDNKEGIIYSEETLSLARCIVHSIASRNSLKLNTRVLRSVLYISSGYCFETGNVHYTRSYEEVEGNGVLYVVAKVAATVAMETLGAQKDRVDPPRRAKKEEEKTEAVTTEEAPAESSEAA